MGELMTSGDVASVAAFDMLVGRLSDLEDNVSQIFQFLREPHMRNFLKLDERFFKWSLGDYKVTVRYDALVQVCLHPPGKHVMMLLRLPGCSFLSKRIEHTRTPAVKSVRLTSTPQGCLVWLEGVVEHYVDWFVNFAVNILAVTARLHGHVCMDAWPLLPDAKSGIYAVVHSCKPAEIRSAIDNHMPNMNDHHKWLYVQQHPVCQNSELINQAYLLNREILVQGPDPWRIAQ